MKYLLIRCDDVEHARRIAAGQEYKGGRILDAGEVDAWLATRPAPFGHTLPAPSSSPRLSSPGAQAIINEAVRTLDEAARVLQEVAGERFPTLSRHAADSWRGVAHALKNLTA